MLSFVHIGLLVLIFSLLVTSLWSVVVSGYEYLVAGKNNINSGRMMSWRPYRYVSVMTNNNISDDNDLEDQIMGIEVEMTRQDSNASAILQKRGQRLHSTRPSS